MRWSVAPGASHRLSPFATAAHRTTMSAAWRSVVAPVDRSASRSSATRRPIHSERRPGAPAPSAPSLQPVVVVAQTLYTSTMEHIREFGTVKAIGGGNGLIYSILGKQASIAAVAGYIVGTAMAFAMQPAIAKIDLKLIIPPQLAVWVFAGALVMCLASAIVSFRKVASIDPALVFRT